MTEPAHTADAADAEEAAADADASLAVDADAAALDAAPVPPLPAFLRTAPPARASGALVLEVERLVRTYGNVRAVDGLSFAVEAGALCGFIGPNGSGKTTTMRIAATLDVPDSGDVRVDGRSVLVDPRRARDRIGFMSDQLTAYPDMDVLQYLDFFARAYGLVGRERRHTVRDVAGFCGLGTFLDRPATGLSKGMGQRLHLAKTLLHDPMLLLLDEPASGLDPRARIELRALLRELAHTGKAILISSHILTELSEMCDAVVMIEAGRLIVGGRVDDVRRQSREHHTIAIRLLGAADKAERFLLTQPLVREVTVLDPERIALDYLGDEAAMASLLAACVREGLPVVAFAAEEQNLEDVFLRSTEGRLQ